MFFINSNLYFSSFIYCNNLFTNIFIHNSSEKLIEIFNCSISDFLASEIFSFKRYVLSMKLLLINDIKDFLNSSLLIFFFLQYSIILAIDISEYCPFNPKDNVVFN